jgi:hypothetical protein
MRKWYMYTPAQKPYRVSYMHWSWRPQESPKHNITHYQTARRDNSNDQVLNYHWRRDLKSQTSNILLFSRNISTIIKRFLVHLLRLQFEMLEYLSAGKDQPIRNQSWCVRPRLDSRQRRHSRLRHRVPNFCGSSSASGLFLQVNQPANLTQCPGYEHMEI